MPKTGFTDIEDAQSEPESRVTWIFRVQLEIPTLPNGVPTYFFADTDENIVATIQDVPYSPGLATYTWHGFPMDRKQGIKTNAQLKIDEMTLGVPNCDVNFSGRWLSLGAIALRRCLDQGIVEIFKYNAAHPGNTCPRHSSWIIENTTVTASTVTLQLVSMWAQMKRQSPRTLHQLQCNNSFCDNECGQLKTNWTSAVVDAGGSTPNAVNLTVTGTDFIGNPKGANGYYALGQIVGTSGVNFGAVSEVYSHIQIGSVGTLTLLTPFPYAPSAGDTFNVVPGCDGAITTCALKFNNLRGVGGCKGFRGTTKIPPIEKTFGDPPPGGVPV